jgi:hypothetical protein
MVELVATIVKLADEQTDERRRILDYLPALLDELKRLDPRDFVPEARHDFIVARVDVQRWKEQWTNSGTMINQFNQSPRMKPAFQQLMSRIVKVLEKYGGEGWRAETRSFSFIKDAELRAIIERDYKELILVLFPGGAWKSTVIMAGSILEAILFDRLTDPLWNAKAMASSVAPKIKGGATIKVEDWKLEGLIKVAAAIGLFPQDRADTFDQVLRDYRNFVHPKKEMKAAHPCSEGEAQLAVGGLNALCDCLPP